MIIQTVLFYVFSLLMTGAAVAVISVKNPVHSVLFLIFAFFNAAGLFLLLGAEFVAMTLVIVYVGAVAVLFLFVVMMMDINLAEIRQGFLQYLPIGILIILVLCAELFMMLKASVSVPAKLVAPAVTIAEKGRVTNTHALGEVLYTHYAFPFQMAGLILLVAMIGSIVLTLRQRPGVRRQKAREQVGRTRAASVEVVNVKSGAGVDGLVR